MGEADALAISRRIYDRLVTVSSAPPPRIRAWDGSIWGPAESRSTVVLNHPGSLRALMFPPNDLTAGEAYLYDDVDVEGDILEVLEFAASVAGSGVGRAARFRLARDLRRLPAEHRRTAASRPRVGGRLHSLRRDREAVSYHYDTGNDFYSLFLGGTMTYSCAYFLDPTESLDTAQHRKLDLICRKLELSPGMRFLDVGCGWGSLLIHAASNYGVTATGVTLSGEQAEHARRRAKELGLEDRVTVLEVDYRELKDEFEAIASVGMFEHVGRKKLPEYFRQTRRLLAPGGQFLNHGITLRNRQRRRGKPRPTFISTYVFPDGELEPVDLIAGEAESAGFELRDLESLRASYEQTLRRWVANIQENSAAAVAATNERTYRIWRLYMAGSAIGFRHGTVAVYQMLLTDPARPWRYGRRRLLAKDDS